MRTIYTQWDVGDIVLLSRDNGLPCGGQRDHDLISYYNVAMGGHGHIDLRTGQLTDRRHRRS